MATLPADDRDLDDAALWAVIDSAAAAVSTASYSSPSLKTTTATATTTTTTNTPRFRSPLTLTHSNFRTPPSKPPHYVTSPVNNDNDNDFRRPSKIQRSSSSCISEPSNLSPPPLLAHWPIKPVQPSPIIEHRVSDDKENFTHCLSGRFPTVSLFKDYQDAAMAVLDKSDYTMISGSPFIKKSGWRKIAFYFNVSFEIKDKTIEFDHNRNVQRAEFVVRAYMQGGRFSDGWGSCERREKRFMKPNNDIPSTAETRAKNKACQDLIGIGQYRHSASHSHFPSPR